MQFVTLFALYIYINNRNYLLSTKIYGNFTEYLSQNSSKISYFPVFPTLPKLGVFPRTVITTGNSRHRYFPANLDVNKDVVSFEQPGPEVLGQIGLNIHCRSKSVCSFRIRIYCLSSHLHCTEKQTFFHL